MTSRTRELSLLIGAQASGKTYQLVRAITFYERRSACDCVHVVDPWGELAHYHDWSAHDAIIISSEAAYHSHVAILEHRIPRIVIWRTDSGEPAFRAAIEQGNCCVVLDEAYYHAPGGGGGNWKGSPLLYDIVLRGRHLRNSEGTECATDLILACQYPRSVHHLIYDQANAILCSKLRGEQARKWIREYAGVEALERTDSLDLHEWAVIAGKRPRWF